MFSSNKQGLAASLDLLEVLFLRLDKLSHVSCIWCASNGHTELYRSIKYMFITYLCIMCVFVIELNVWHLECKAIRPGKINTLFLALSLLNLFRINYINMHVK
jgi:hypothetical protein